MRAAWSLFTAALLTGCAVPPIDRYLLQTERTPVRLEGARGLLTPEQSRKVIAGLAARSGQTGILERHLAVEEALAGNPLSIGNRVQLLQDGPATYAAMLAAIASAKHHVHLETYIFEADEVGQKFADALAARVRAGVKVRVVYDAVGSIGTPKTFFKAMEDRGIEVAEFGPVNAGTVLLRGPALNHRNHRKLTVVDGRVAFLGGINISGVYASGSLGSHMSSDKADGSPPWRDTQVRIEGPAVADLQKGFLRMWAQIRKEETLTDARLFPAADKGGPHAVRVVEAWVDEGINPLYVTLISAVQNAEARVYITMAYFVPHQELVAALKDAARRGVDVQLLLPGRTDHWLVFHAGRSFYEELLEAGVKIFERDSRLLHAKTATIDGVWSTVGSTNLDWRSLADNDEVNAVVLGPEFADGMQAAFSRDLGHSQQILPEAWRSRPWSDRVREISARTWARAL
ncbi:MAG: cardiolipin synthase [Usitatibacter sp.]